MTDALSNEIEIGKVYGYSQNSNGITNIFVGIAKNITPTGLVSKINAIEITKEKMEEMD